MLISNQQMTIIQNKSSGKKIKKKTSFIFENDRRQKHFNQPSFTYIIITEYKTTILDYYMIG